MEIINYNIPLTNEDDFYEGAKLRYVNRNCDEILWVDRDTNHIIHDRTLGDLAVEGIQIRYEGFTNN